MQKFRDIAMIIYIGAFSIGGSLINQFSSRKKQNIPDKMTKQEKRNKNGYPLLIAKLLFSELCTLSIIIIPIKRNPIPKY